MSHETKKKEVLTLPVLDFIGKVIQHIQKKGFRLVRRYGLYSRRSNKLSQVIVDLYKFMKQMNIWDLLKKKNSRVEKKKTWKQRIIECFKENPIACSQCKTEMELFRIWHHKYGVIYDFIKNIKRKAKETVVYERKPKFFSVWSEDRGRRRNHQISLFEM